MKKLLPIGTLGLAGLVGVGLMSFQGTTAAANLGDDAVTKREDSVVELVLVDDDDDGDSNDDTGSRASRFTGATGPATGARTAPTTARATTPADVHRTGRLRWARYATPGV